MRRICQFGLPLLLAVVVTVLSASPAQAGEFTFSLGSLLTDTSPYSGAVEFRRPDAASLLFAGRLGGYSGRVGFEGSVTYSAKALRFALFDGALTSDARAIFGEFNVLVNILQGSFQPFVTGGIGAHVYELTDIDGDPAVKFGYNFGAGLRYVSGSFVFRGDVRDHITKLDVSDFGLGLEDVIAGETSGTVHNVELSVGIGVIF
jgi:hypothetical protein